MRPMVSEVQTILAHLRGVSVAFGNLCILSLRFHMHGRLVQSNLRWNESCTDAPFLLACTPQACLFRKLGYISQRYLAACVGRD